jgi:phosphoglycerate kinase
VGTASLARSVASLTHSGKLVSVAGGGDSVSALAGAGVSESFTYISTAGGAFLEWLEGKELPGISILKKTSEDTISGNARERAGA